VTDTLICIVAGYLAGSMPWGYWLVRAFRHEDIRTKGSGNIGASNVWRVYGRKLGVPVLLLDVAKGCVPALVATHTAGYLAGALAGGAAMLGHYRPLFLGFQRGGKIVATGGGAFFGVAPLAALVGLGVWILVFVVTRYPSVASMVTALSLPLWAWLFGYPWPVIVFGVLTAIGVLLLHRANIGRLWRGEEHRSTLWRRWWRGTSGATSL
jgi:acyl phosphate:glycerol-3-phosphate acyltransferase